MKAWAAASLLGALALTGCASMSGRFDVDGSRAAYEQGVAAYEGKRYEEAVKHFSRAIEYNPNNHEAYLMRGKTRMRQIDHGDGSRYSEATGKAHEDFSDAVRIYPLNFQAYYHRAVAYASVAQYQRAAYELVNHCLRLRPEDALSHLLLGRVYDEGFEGMQARALEAYQNYLKHAGPQADPAIKERVADLKMRVALEAVGTQDEALASELFDKALKLISKGDRTEALKLLGELKARYPNTRSGRGADSVIQAILKGMQEPSPPTPVPEKKDGPE